METTNKVKLRIDNLSLNIGGVTVLRDVSLDIREKEILAIIGPNGSWQDLPPQLHKWFL